MAKTISIASRKAKARKLQQLVAKYVSDITEIEYGKDKLIESREMGQSGVDVKLIGEALEIFPFSIECKAQKSFKIPSWIEQAKKNTIKNTDWLLICKRNFEDPIIILDMQAFFNIYEELIGYRICNASKETKK